MIREQRVGIAAAWTLAFAVVLSACATAPRDGTSRDRVITRSELAAAGESTLYDVIGRVRPTWLGPSGAAEGGDDASLPTVYMNRLPLGGTVTLASVRARDVVEVRLITPALARDRYGADNPAGVIELVTTDVGAY
jgi:hypothetical protein